MLKKSKKIALNFKILGFFLIPTILISTPFFNKLQGGQSGLEFQWDQYSGHRPLKWFQKDSRRSIRNKIYFFLRPNARKTSLLKLDIILPETFKSKLKKENISFCKVEIGGFQGRTKCLEEIPADIEINYEESSDPSDLRKSSFRRLIFYPYSPIPYSKDNYAVVLKAVNPRRTGLYQFHSYGQPAGKSTSTYLGSWTILID